MDSKLEDLFYCVHADDVETLKQLFDETVEVSDDPEEVRKEDLLEAKDEAGRNALLVASMLGRSEIVRELVAYGAQVNEPTIRGYTALHLAACWGHLETVTALLELGAEIQAETFKGEKPVDLATKHNRTDCIECLTEPCEDELSTEN